MDAHDKEEIEVVQTEKQLEEARQREEERRKKVDSLWTSMKSGEPVTQKSTNYLAAYEASLKTNAKKVTKTYEFAGQQFRLGKHCHSVTFPLGLLRSLSSFNSIQKTITTVPSPKAAPVTTTTPERSAPKARKSRLKEIAERFGVGHEAAKLTVLEKSKLDWMMHVEEYGDSDKLLHHRKDGYVYFGAALMCQVRCGGVLKLWLFFQVFGEERLLVPHRSTSGGTYPEFEEIQV